VRRVLGISLGAERVAGHASKGLNLQVERPKEDFIVTPPSTASTSRSRKT
jgi:hypothetical protein